jgi:hypothetical protein
MRTRRIIAVALLAALPGPAAGQGSPESPGEPSAPESPWRLILRDQIKHEKNCDLNEVIAFQEVPLGDEVGLDGRVSCVDGREFNFTRKRKHQKFTIELCEPAVC